MFLFICIVCIGSYCLIEKFDNSNKTKVFGELYKLLSQSDEKDLKKLNKWLGLFGYFDFASY